MDEVNMSDLENNSYTFFGPIEMGHHEDADAVKIILSLSLGILMAICLIGNVLICAVIIRDRTMKTPTNCYLFNLAISDLLLGLCIPVEIYCYWTPEFYPFGEEGCRFHFMVWEILSNNSVLTILAFTIERYLVVTKPFLRQKLSSNPRVLKIIAVNWIVSLLFSIPDMFHTNLLKRKKYAYCYFTTSKALEVLLAVEIFMFFVLPMTVITVLYILIILQLKSAHCNMQESPVTGNQDRDKAIKMLAAVAWMFFFCWAPFCLYRLMILTPGYREDEYFGMWQVVNYICSVNSSMSTAVNPILYSLMSRKFRRAFKDFLKGKKSWERSRFSSTLTTKTHGESCNGVNMKEINQNVT